MSTLYEQVAESIRRQIADGRLRLGDPIPSSRALAEQWAASRATVTKAMDVLRAEGLIVAKLGEEFRVTEQPIARAAGQRRRGRTRVDGGAPFRRLGKPAMEPAPPHVAAALGVGEGVPVLRRARLMLGEAGEVTSLVIAYFPSDIAAAAPLLSGTAPIPGGTTRHVAAMTGRAPAEGEDVTYPRLATDFEAEQLGLELPCAVEVTLHTAWDAHGVALVVEEGVTGPDAARQVERYPMGL